MTEDKLAIASDHAGFALKKELIAEFAERGIELLDLGCDGPESVDYPDYGKAMAKAIEEGRATRGILICGTGVGISIAANRSPAVRCALCHDVTGARLARRHNDANVLALGARTTGHEVVRDCIATFLETPFEGGRHARRVGKLG